MPAQDVVLCTQRRVGKSLVSLAEAQKKLPVARARRVRVKTLRERTVYALKSLFVRLRTNSQDLVVIDGKDVFFWRVGSFDVQRQCAGAPGKQFDILAGSVVDISPGVGKGARPWNNRLVHNRESDRTKSMSFLLNSSQGQRRYITSC